MTSDIINALGEWTEAQYGRTGLTLHPLAGDASFRRYFRMLEDGRPLSCLAVYAPNATENNPATVAVAAGLRRLQLRVPDIKAYDLERGFLLVEDFGNDLLFRCAEREKATVLYRQALKPLLQFYKTVEFPEWSMGSFNEQLLLQELHWFEHWFLNIHCGVSLTSEEQQKLHDVFHQLQWKAQEQPQVLIHRDYHSRNLMCLPEGDVGILDWQDAMWGPITYDAVSLLRDCYKQWPVEWVRDRLREHYDELIAQHLIQNTWEEYEEWFDWMGIQRHLKAIFIFARKYHRDGVDAYLPDIQVGLSYLQHVLPRYHTLHFLKDCLERHGLFSEVTA